MSVLVLGASSFIGKNICKYINAKKIIAVIRPLTQKKNEIERIKSKKIEIIEYDVFKTDHEIKLYNIIRECDVCIMLAWMGTKREDRNKLYLHARSSKILLQFMKEFSAAFPQCKFIMCGTQAEYGRKAGLVTEESNCDPCTEYGKQKYNFFQNAFSYSKEHNIKFIELRFHSVIGKDDDSAKMIQQVIIKLQNKEYVYMNSDCSQMWNFIGVEELCHGIEKAIITDLENGAYNIGSAQSDRLKNYLIKISQIICGSNRIFFSSKKDQTAPDFIFCCDKFFNAVGWSPLSDFEQQIRKML